LFITFYIRLLFPKVNGGDNFFGGVLYTAKNIFKVIISLEKYFKESKRTMSNIYLRMFHLGSSIVGGGQVEADGPGCWPW